MRFPDRIYLTFFRSRFPAGEYLERHRADDWVREQLAPCAALVLGDNSTWGEEDIDAILRKRREALLAEVRAFLDTPVGPMEPRELDWTALFESVRDLRLGDGKETLSWQFAFHSGGDIMWGACAVCRDKTCMFDAPLDLPCRHVFHRACLGLSEVPALAFATEVPPIAECPVCRVACPYDVTYLTARAFADEIEPRGAKPAAPRCSIS